MSRVLLMIQDSNAGIYITDNKEGRLLSTVLLFEINKHLPFVFGRKSPFKLIKLELFLRVLIMMFQFLKTHPINSHNTKHAFRLCANAL